ncbi:MAG: DUF359 domain-containing protein [Thaumarchaeota archaeon]|nr:DUF359 domain-containing protein [Nitrososphaerota archaeon]
MSEELRRLLKAPLGSLILADEVSKSTVEERVKGCKLIVAVGDRTTESLFSMNIVPDVHVIDGLEKRMVRDLPVSTFVTEIRVRNPAGFISEEAIGAVEESFQRQKPVRILVEGEEDLLALIFAAKYPEGTAILYGQPGEGVVVLIVDRVSKELAVGLLRDIGIE